MPLPFALETKCNAAFNDFVAKLKPLQTAYFAKYGVYWQGKDTPPTIPADGSKIIPDKFIKPTDQTHDWNTFKIDIASSELQFACDTYHNQNGHGYAARGNVISSGVQWVRGENIIGTDTEFTHGWRKIVKF